MKKNFFDKMHVWGTVWNYAALIAMMMVPVIASICLNSWPDLGILGKVLAVIIPLYWTTGIIEVVSYVPMLGAGGTYLSFVTGNISNMKLPCGLNAMENAKVRPNTEEGEVICTIAIAVSAITTTLIIAIGVLCFAPVLPKLTAEGSAFKIAFENVLPALFGALGASYFIKHFRLAVPTIILGVIVLIFAPTINVGVLMFVTIIIAIITALIMYKSLWYDDFKNRKKTSEKKA